MMFLVPYESLFDVFMSRESTYRTENSCYLLLATIAVSSLCDEGTFPIHVSTLDQDIH